MNTPLHVGKYYRYLWEEKGLLTVLGHFEEVAVSRRLYEERHRIPTTVAGDDVLNRIMGAAALAAVSLSERESWGWTITLPGSPFGFFCGVEPEGMICGRVRPSENDKGAIYVQRQKGNEPMTQSFFEPGTDNPVQAVARYFEQAVQVGTRIALDTSCSGVLLQALPGGQLSAVAEIGEEQLIEQMREMAERKQLSPVGEVLIFYECRCDDDMILNMVTKLPEPQRHALWGDEKELRVECPRCGREYVVGRAKGQGE